MKTNLMEEKKLSFGQAKPPMLKMNKSKEENILQLKETNSIKSEQIKDPIKRKSIHKKMAMMPMPAMKKEKSKEESQETQDFSEE